MSRVFSRRSLIFTAALFCAMTLADYAFGRYSDSFEYARRVVNQSAVIQRETGGVRDVRLCLLWCFSYRTGFGNSTSSVALRVEGMQRSLNLTLDLKQIDGQWTVAHSSAPL